MNIFSPAYLLAMVVNGLGCLALVTYILTTELDRDDRRAALVGAAIFFANAILLGLAA